MLSAPKARSFVYAQTNHPDEEVFSTQTKERDQRTYIHVEAIGEHFYAYLFSEPNLPYVGEGRSWESAVNSLNEMLKDALETILEAGALSPTMEKQKTVLLKVFEYERTSDL